MPKSICAFVAAALLIVAAPSFADDSRRPSARGIVLVKNTPVRMAAENLHVGPKAVRIRFTFVNDTDKDVETIVAFPLPDIDTAEFWGSGIGTVTYNPVNFVGFKAVVDGKPVPFKVEQRAILKGKDVMALIASTGAPIDPVAGEGYRKLDKLSSTSASASWMPASPRAMPRSSRRNGWYARSSIGRRPSPDTRPSSSNIPNNL